MTNLLLLIFARSKSAEKTIGDKQDCADTKEDQKKIKKDLKKIRAALFNAFLEIILISTFAIAIACLINHLGCMTTGKLKVYRFIFAMITSIAVSGRLSWEIQTWKGNSIPEQAAKDLYKLLYRIGIFGMLSSLAINT